MNHTIPVLLLFVAIAVTGIANQLPTVKLVDVYSQSGNKSNSVNNLTAASQVIINIRGITSFTEKNMVALVSTTDDVQAKKVDVDKAVIQAGEENSFSPSKMIDVTIQMNKAIKPNTEVTACVLQLGSTDFNQNVKCNTIFSQVGNMQKIIVPL